VIGVTRVLHGYLGFIGVLDEEAKPGANSAVSRVDFSTAAKA
jgi:hypothetical protein